MTYDPVIYWSQRDYNQLEFQNPLEEEYMISVLQELEPADIVEIGPGVGRIYMSLRRNGFDRNYMAFDISRKCMEGHEENTGYRPIEWDGKILPVLIEEKEWDLCISFNVLLHVPPEDILDHLEERLFFHIPHVEQGM